MRLGLIGDVHAEDELLELTIDALHREGVDRVLCTGDLVDGHGDVDRACRLLRSVGALTVRGNHDRWIRTDDMRGLPYAHRMTELAVETITQLKELPQTSSLDIPDGKLLLCHGVGPNDMCRLGPDDRGYALSANEDLLAILFDTSVRVMVGGHTHRPMVRRFPRGAPRSGRPGAAAPAHPALVVVNPGTLAREDEPGFAVLDLASARVDFHRIVDRRAVRASSIGI